MALNISGNERGLERKGIKSTDKGNHNNIKSSEIRLHVSVSSRTQRHGGKITGGLIRKRVLLMMSPRGTALKKIK